MPASALAGIFFDEQDANLFLVDAARLRADALKHSVLPRLRVLMNVAIARIREWYGIEVLEDSIISMFPNFREKRYKHALTHKYDAAFVGLGGQRKAKWPGVARRDGKPVGHPEEQVRQESGSHRKIIMICYWSKKSTHVSPFCGGSMHKLGFLDFHTRLLRIDKAGDPLAKLDEATNWEQFVQFLSKPAKTKKIRCRRQRL